MSAAPEAHLPPSAQPPEEPVRDRYAMLFQMLLDSIPCSVVLVDRGLRTVSANRNFIQKSRREARTVIGQSLESLLPPVIFQQMRLADRVPQVLDSGEAVTGERVAYRAPRLGARTYYCSLIPVPPQGGAEQVMLLMEDVTQQVRLGEEVRRAERHLASIVDSASDIILSTDLQGRILTWNAAAERVSGRREAEVRGFPLPDLCREGRIAAMRRVLHQVRSRGLADPLEVDLVAADGRSIPVAWVCSPMHDAGGAITGLVAVGRDLTERRAFEAQSLRWEKLAALGVMAGGIAHEVRNPLAVISSAAQLLLEVPLSKEVERECAERIHQAALRASSIIERLLRFARPSEQREFTSLNLVQAVEDALVLVGNQLRLGKVRLQKRFPDAPLLVLGSAGLIQQLVTNLVLNAVNAMPRKGGRIVVDLETENAHVHLRVADTGKGIRPPDLPKVFDPFFTTMPAGKGTGLGLSICYAIVRLHHGTIDLASRPRSGTTVTVTLPLAQEQSLT